MASIEQWKTSNPKNLHVAPEKAFPGNKTSRNQNNKKIFKLLLILMTWNVMVKWRGVRTSEGESVQAEELKTKMTS